MATVLPTALARLILIGKQHTATHKAGQWREIGKLLHSDSNRLQFQQNGPPDDSAIQGLLKLLSQKGSG
jgi:hypothetical protein